MVDDWFDCLHAVMVHVWFVCLRVRQPGTGLGLVKVLNAPNLGERLVRPWKRSTEKPAGTGREAQR